MKNLKLLILIFIIFPVSLSFSQKKIDQELLLATSTNDSKKVYDLLRKGADVNTKTEYGITPLMYAVDNSNYQICIKLLEKGADINIVPDYSPPALIAATKNNDFKITELLIINGADLNIEYFEGYSAKNALTIALNNQYYDIADLLLFYGAFPDKSIYALVDAVFSNDTTAVKMLIKYNVNLDLQKNGYYPLKMAVATNNFDLVKLLVENNVKITSEVLSIAIENHYNKILEYLIKKQKEKESDFNFKPLYEQSIVSENIKAKKILVKNGAKRSYKPIISDVAIGYVNHFNTKDYLMGASIGFTEKRYKLDLFTGLISRVYSKKIWIPQSEHLYYQIEENRTFAYVEMNKRFNLFRDSENTKYGIFIGGKYIYSFGKYNVSFTQFKPEFLYSPQIGIYLKTDYFYLRFHYEYLDLNQIKQSPNRYNISLYITI